MKAAIVKIETEEKLSFTELEAEISAGSRFVMFQYCVSIVALSFRMFSPAILLSPGDSSTKYILKYNMITMLFGWWGIPWGPIYTIESLKLN